MLGSSALARWGRRELLDPLMRSAYSLILNSVLTALLGLVFWVLAARVRSSQQVGQDSALIAAMMTLSSIFQLNLANTITRFLPGAGPRAQRWVIYAYGIATSVTLAGSAAFVLVIPHLSRGLGFVGTDTGLAFVFVGATALWSIFGLQDAVMTALRRAPWIPAENTLYGVLKLVCLAGFATVAFTHTVFIAWILPMALLLVPVNYLIFGHFVPAYVNRHRVARPVRELLPTHGVRRFLVADYFGSIAQEAALALPALLVVSLLGSSANAYFYVPFLLVTSFDTLFFNASVALVVEGAFKSGTTAQLAGRVIARLGRFVIPGVLLMILAGPLLLLAFGSGYSSHGALVMRILAATSVFRIAISLFIAVSRINGRGGAILAVYGGIVMLLVPLIVLLAPVLGVEGAALAWLIANGLVALAVAPSLAHLLDGGGLRWGIRRRLRWMRSLSARLTAQSAGRTPTRGVGVRWSLMAGVGMLTSAAAVPACLVSAPTGVRFVVLLAYLCTAPGTTVVGTLEPRLERVSPVLVIASGLAMGAIAAQLLLWTSIWRPDLVGAISALICLFVLMRMWTRRV